MDNKEEVFEYLDTIRATGRINMMAAGSYLETEFDISPNKARKLLLEWMDSK